MSVHTCACARPRVSAAWPGRPLVHNRSSVFRAGEPGREVAPRQAPAALDSRQLRFPHGLRQLLQGRAPRPRRHPRGAAPPAAAREHLAAPQGPAAPEAAALCFPAGRSAGGSRAALVRRGAICRWSPGARPSHRLCAAGEGESHSLARAQGTCQTILGLDWRLSFLLEAGHGFTYESNAGGAYAGVFV